MVIPRLVSPVEFQRQSSFNWGVTEDEEAAHCVLRIDSHARGEHARNVL